MYPVAATNVNYGRGATLDSGVVYMGQERSELLGPAASVPSTAWISPDGTPNKVV